MKAIENNRMKPIGNPHNDLSDLKDISNYNPCMSNLNYYQLKKFDI